MLYLQDRPTTTIAKCSLWRLLCCADKQECGGVCIDPTQQCCPAEPFKGVQCPTGQACNSTTYACQCSSNSVTCGSQCIDPTWQCCASQYSLGKQCPSGTLCLADGGSCQSAAAIRCPGGASGTCGRLCFDSTTNCCLNATTSTTGEVVGSSCYAAPFCALMYTNDDGASVAIVGKRCSSAPNSPCKECCADTDCPAYANGQRCLNGTCELNGCTVFTCFNGNSKLVCKLSGKTCSSSNQNTVRCPAGTCYGNGNAGCTSTCAGNQPYCCAVGSTCGKGYGSMSGRECTNKPCGFPDPFYGVTATSTSYQTYQYPTCDRRRRRFGRLR
ncbi:hypothetical protein ABPG77_004436 [Micractinium sp. CCAP 211/92]